MLLLYNLFFYSFALSTERTWFDYISLLVIPCIIYYVTKKTLNLDLIFLLFPDFKLAWLIDWWEVVLENEWTHSCIETHWWLRRSLWWCFQDMKCSSSVWTRPGRFHEDSGCNDEPRCYNSDLENTTLHTQTPLSHGLTSWSFLRTHMDHKSLRARFTKQNKSAWDSNPIKVQWERKKLQLINAQTKEYRCSWIISVIIDEIYKKQCRLA